MGDRWVRRVADLNADLSAAALRTRQSAAETSMVTRDDEVGPELRNGLVEIHVSGVATHRLRAMLLTVGSDGVAVFSEVAERPMNCRHCAAFR